MLRLNRQQRRLLSEKVPDIANLGAAALVFGQFVGGQRVSITVLLAGVAVWAALIGIALRLTNGERPR